MEKITSFDQLLNNAASQDAEKQRREREIAYINANAPASIDVFERALNSIVQSLFNQQNIEISINMDNSQKGRGKISKGHAYISYQFQGRHLSLTHHSSRNTQTKDEFVAITEEPAPTSPNQQWVCTILWKAVKDDKLRVTPDQLALSITNELLKL